MRLGKGGETVKFNDNIAAIRLVQQLEQEKRRATPEEQNVLARYVGWGGLANAFANGKTGDVKEGWESREALLRELLSPEEYDIARNSTQNAHYTSIGVVKGIWEAVSQLGFTGGNVLEPSVGTGNFIGLIPRALSGVSNFIGAEYEAFTAAIAKLLYPRSAIMHSGFEKLAIPREAFDLVIGNPPFGKKSLTFKYSPDINRHHIHNQFFLAGLDALRPGGIQAMVVSRYLMDAKDSTVRQEIEKSAKLLGAIRLPDTAFKENARTEVVTDIIFLQKLTQSEIDERSARYEQAKKDKRPILRPAWLETTEIADPLGGDPMTVNTYFANKPSAIIGTLERSGSMRFKNDMTVRFEGNLEQTLSEKVKSILPSNVTSNLTAPERSLQQFENMRDGIEIALAGHEDGSVTFDELGNLVQVLDREAVGGDHILTKRILSEESVWSAELSLDKNGKWFEQQDAVDEKGAKLKVTKDGKATTRNVKIRKVFETEAEIPSSRKLGSLGMTRLRDAVTLMNTTKKQIELETSDSGKKEIEANRKELWRQYRRFVETHGFLHSREIAKLVTDIPNPAVLLSLEHSYKPAVTTARAKQLGIKSRPSSVKEAAILTERVVYPYETPDKADSPADALAISLAEAGKVDMDLLSQLLKKSEEDTAKALHDDLEEPLIYFNPESEVWETTDEYLSGNVVKKLEAAKRQGNAKNIKALKAIQPEPWTADQVTPIMGAPWIPERTYADFITHLTGKAARVTFLPLTNTWSARGDVDDSSMWNTPKRNAVEIVDAILRGKTIRITETIGYGDNKQTVFDAENTELALQKATEITAEFDSWVFRDSDRRDMLVDTFNKKYNFRVTKQRQGQHLKLPGKVPDQIVRMRRHQLNAIWRGISERFTLYDHAVGAGKTYTAIARAMERRRMGISRKPMIVVPNHLVAQFTADVYALYPGSKVLAAGKKDLERKKRRRLFAKIATGDFDIVIVPHSSFQFIGISPVTEERYLREELELAIQGIADAEAQAAEDGEDGGRFKPLGVKMAEAMRDNILEKLEKLQARSLSKDRLLTFEQLGVDDLTVDESHEFKNLFYHSTLNVRGMNPKQGSAKAFDLWTKIRTLRESKTGSVCFMTGTPISNSAVEMYGILRYLAADELSEMGISHFDAWRTTFATVSTEYEPTESGRGLKEVNRLGRDWSNMKSLMDLYYSVSDSVSNEDIIKAYAEDNDGARFPIPLVKGGGRVGVNVSPTAAQTAELERIVAGFESLPDMKDIKERNAERLRLMDQARKVSLDVRALGPNSSEEKGGKLEKVAENIHRIYKQWNKDKGTQLVFCDRGVPKSKSDLKILKDYDALIRRLNNAERIGDASEMEKILNSLELYNKAEVEEMRIAQTTNWNAYQQIKDNLVALGIPENEIRFMQEANTDDQKKAIFEEVNAGAVRILIGSTPRMGAGTNVQERLVGLHHVDVTWKPSDIEQREGRIIRQGNQLLTKYGDKFEVEILAYTTDTTIDAKMWSLNSTKLKMINGIRSYSGEFNMEFDDEDSVNMAEIAAIASGEPLQLERIKLSTELDKLDRLRRGHERQKWGLESKLARAKRVIEENPAAIAAIEKVVVKLDASFKERDSDRSKRTITIDGMKFNGDQVETVLALAKQSILSAKTKADDATKAAQEKDEKAEEIKPDIKIEIDGKIYRSRDAVEQKIIETLGSVNDFYAKIGGELFINQSLAAKKLNDLVNEKIRAGETDGKFATYSIGDIDIDVSFQIDDISVQGKKSVWETKENGGVRIFFELDEKTPDGKRISIVSTDNLYQLNEKGEAELRAWAFNDVSKIEYLPSWARTRQDELDDARKNMPEYQRQVDIPFAKEQEIVEKQARLNEVEAILESRASAKTAPASSPAASENKATLNIRINGEKLKPVEGKHEVFDFELEGKTYKAIAVEQDGDVVAFEYSSGAKITDLNRHWSTSVRDQLEDFLERNDITGEQLDSAIAGNVRNYGLANGPLESQNQNVNFDPSPDEAASVFAGVEGKTVSEIAGFIAKTAPSKAMRIVAEKVKQALEAQAKSGMNFSFKVAHVGDRVPYSLVNARGVSITSFDGTNNVELWVNGPDVTGKVGASYETVLHELIHAATQGAVHLGNLQRFKGTDISSQVSDLYAVTNQIVRHFNARTVAAKRGQIKLTEFEQRIFDSSVNALSTPHEILAWAMSNKDMQDYLDTIKLGRSRTLWSKFVQAVRNLLGLDSSSDTALSEVLRIGEELLLSQPMGLFAELKTAIPATQTQTTAFQIASQRISKAASALTASFVKGTPHTGLYKNTQAMAQLTPGAILTLTREADNVHDKNAIKIMLGTQAVGYVDKKINAKIAARMDAGEKLQARISKVSGRPVAPRLTVMIGSPDAMAAKPSSAPKDPNSPPSSPRPTQPRKHGQTAIDKLLLGVLGADKMAIMRDIKQNGLTPANEQALLAAEITPEPETGKARDLWKAQFFAAPKAVARKSLALLTLRQLREIYHNVKPVENFYQATRETAADTTKLMGEADKVYEKWSKLDAKDADVMSMLMSEATVASVSPDVPFESRLDIDEAREKIEKSADTLINLQDSLVDVDDKLKWHEDRINRLAGEIEAEQKRFSEHKRLSAKYDGMSKEAKAVYQEVRKMYDANLGRVRDGLISRLERSTMSDASKKMAMDSIRLKFETYLRNGPYFPLSRFGEYIVQITDADGKREVHFFDFIGQRDRAVARWQKETTADGEPRWTIKQKTSKDYSPETDGASSQFVSDMAKVIDNSTITAGEKSGLIDELNQLFIKSMPDMSHRKHFSHRKKVEGYSRDQIRAFASNMQHAAHHIARIRHADKMTAALSDLNEIVQTSEGSADLTHITDLFNELNKRHQILLNPKISPIAQALTSFGFIWNIGPSIASALVNMSQTPLVAFPMLGTRFNDGRGAFMALRRASAQYFGSPFVGSKGFDMAQNKKLSENTRKMLAALEDDGTIDTSMALSLAQATSADLLNLAQTKNGGQMLKVMRVVSYPFHVTEVANRQITAVAAYDLAVKHGKSHEEAISEAREVVLDSHFDYSQANRARFMEGNVQRVLFLFKQYSQQMSFLLGRSFHQAVKGESQAVKDQARKQLLGIVGGHFLVSGAFGMPVIGIIAEVREFLVNALGDDDEPWDWEVALRNMLNDTIGKTAGESIAHGPWRALPVLGELDIASRVSLGDLWLKTPDREAEGKDAWNQYINMALGPLASNGASMAQGLSAMSEGEVARGVEMMLPKAIKDAMKTIRYAREGVTSWQDATLIDELTTVEMFGQALGFSPARINEMYEGKNAIKNLETKLDNRKQHLVNGWVEATRAGDIEMANRYMKDMVQFTKKNPAFAITHQGLAQSMRMRAKVQAQTKNGVYMPAKRVELLEEGRFANL